MGVHFVINPGSGPVEGADSENARRNVFALLADARLGGVITRRLPWRDKNGRFWFRLRLDGRRCDVEMPGLPLERVRFTGEQDQNPFDYPRLYVDGSSWLWCFAIGNVQRRLAPGAGEGA